MHAWQRFVLAGLLSLGAFFLIFRFPAVPVGLHQDEMSEAYESYSLLHTGADRWGAHLPVYFLSWGSGQNVGQAYLSIPVVAALGLTRASARLIPLICNLLCLPLLFATVRRWHGTTAALLALLFLALSPWHIMVSRWGIENSPLPLFLILGVWWFGRALDTQARWRIVPAFVPLAMAMYIYGLVIPIVPVFVLMLLWLGYSRIVQRRSLWIGSVTLFLVLAAPVLLFTVKNYVLKANLPFERSLPLSMPLLPHSRLSEASADHLNARTPLHHNVRFIARMLADDIPGPSTESLFQLTHVWPIQPIIYFLAVAGFACFLWRSIRARKPVEPFVPWLLASLVIFVPVPFTMARGGFLYLPVLALAGCAASLLLGRLQDQRLRAATVTLLVLLVVWPMFRFTREYFGPPQPQIVGAFVPDLPAALRAAKTLAAGREPIFVSPSILLNYVDVLFYEKVDPRWFQQSGATWDHPDFGPYRFSLKSLAQTSKPYTFVIRTSDVPVCSNATDVQTLGELRVGICP